jgi:1,5-anhydro-D-fructose reductase (1,5-anhydro-D-mannitol-forming)
MKTIRWGIIGCGDVTEVKSGPALAKAQHSTLVAVMRRDGARAEAYARRHGVPRWSADAAAIIEADDIDAVYVATPPDTHREYVLRCAAAGKPVLVEKPMALDARECDAMIAACAKARVPLWVAYYRRALPRFLRVRELVAQGAIGDVRIVNSRQFHPFRPPAEMNPNSPPWRVDATHAGGGLFVDMATHTLDFLDYLFGPMTAVRGLATNAGRHYAAEDSVVAAYRFTSGVQGTGTFCYAADRDEEWNEIVGSTGRIRFSTSRPTPIVLERGGHVEEIAVDDPPHVHQPLVQTIVDELNGRGTCPSTGESGARTTRVVDAILADYRQQTMQTSER